MSVEIVDIDGTLTTSGDTPRQDLIDYMKKDVSESDTSFVIVSARPIARLEETQAWLSANDVPHTRVYLNDFSESTGPNVALEFKKYKAEKLIEEFGSELEYAIDNDADIRTMYRSLGIEAYSPEELLANEMSDNNREMPTVHDFELRALPIGDFTVTDGDAGQRTFSGYAALFEKPSAGLPFTEVIAQGAFKRTLSRASRGERMVKFLHGHDENRMLATTASGRLKLSEDANGLRVEAQLDPSDPDAAAVISKLTHEAAAMGMSFGFSVPKGGDVWDGNLRTLKEITLHEVSILSGSTPAYPSTIGLTAVRHISEEKLGVAAERLMKTLEVIKSAQPLNEDDLEVMEAVREKLAPKTAGVHTSVAKAQLRLRAMLDQEI